ncbi:MAG: hypothetical protein GY773_17985 [Actinomycetia bacterium]|nr:hypothetical protein [Actinomycetes bacterium]
MAASPNLIRVNPTDEFGTAIIVTVAITDSAGNTPTAYTDNAQGSSQSIGVISSQTDYWLAYDDTFTLSVLYQGQEIARSGSNTISEYVGQGAAMVIHPKPSNALGTAGSNLLINEGTSSTPYWTPVAIGAGPIWGVETDFRDGVGKAVADTDGTLTIPGSGLRVFGQGIDEDDSGLVAQTAAEGGIEARLTTTNETAHVAAVGMSAGVMQPDQHDVMVVDVELSNVSAITLRSMFVGFIGTAADALDPAVTGATTTATLVQDDLAGVFFDVGLTDGDRLYGVHNKSNEAATQDLTADGDTSTNIAAAGTYQRIRVQISRAGAMTVYVNKASVYTYATALDADEEVSPVLYLESTSAAVKSLDIRRFSAWAYRL